MPQNRTIKIAILLASLLTLIAFAAGFYINQVDLVLRGIFILVPIIASLVILYRYDLIPVYKIKPKKIWITNILYYIFYGLSITTLYYSYYRDIIYFACLSCMFIFLVIDIIYSRVRDEKLILFKIILLFMNLAFGVILNYPFFYGFGDSIGHYYYSQITTLTGNVLPSTLNFGYSLFPLVHIFTSMGHQLSNIDSVQSYYIFTTLPFIFAIIFIYALTKKIINNYKIALLTCLIYSFNYITAQYSHYSVTRVFAFNAFIIVLFLLYKYLEEPIKLHSFILITIINIYIVVVHQTSIAFFLILIFILQILNYIFKNKKFSYLTIGNLVVITAVYYSTIASTYLQTIFRTQLDPTDYENVIITTIPGNIFTFMRNNIHIGIFLIFFTLSINYLFINKSQYANTRIMIIYSFLTLIFYIPTPLQTIFQAMTLLRFDRITLLVSPIISFTMALGFILVIYNLLKTKNKILLTLTLIMMTLFSFFSITTQDNASDSTQIWSVPDKQYYTQGEINMLNFTYTHSYDNPRIYSYGALAKFFEYKRDFQGIQQYNVKSFQTTNLENRRVEIYFTNSIFIPNIPTFNFIPPNAPFRIYDNQYRPIYYTD